MHTAHLCHVTTLKIRFWPLRCARGSPFYDFNGFYHPFCCVFNFKAELYTVPAFVFRILGYGLFCISFCYIIICCVRPCKPWDYLQYLLYLFSILKEDTLLLKFRILIQCQIKKVSLISRVRNSDSKRTNNYMRNVNGPIKRPSEHPVHLRMISPKRPH